MQPPVPQPVQRLARFQSGAVEQEQHGDGDLGGPVQYIGSRPAGGQQQPDRHGSEQSEEEAVDPEFGQQGHRSTVGATRLIAKGDAPDISDHVA